MLAMFVLRYLVFPFFKLTISILFNFVVVPIFNYYIPWKYYVYGSGHDEEETEEGGGLFDLPWQVLWTLGKVISWEGGRKDSSISDNQPRDLIHGREPPVSFVDAISQVFFPKTPPPPPPPPPLPSMSSSLSSLFLFNSSPTTSIPKSFSAQTISVLSKRNPIRRSRDHPVLLSTSVELVRWLLVGSISTSVHLMNKQRGMVCGSCGRKNNSRQRLTSNRYHSNGTMQRSGLIGQWLGWL
ncbi:hypothetical protein C8Q75DRAFT_743974 [Abortiporus biennis]|nr:hypothetical protein C8Q75DRAFT_743974 [Abortiporus biennis]